MDAQTHLAALPLQKEEIIKDDGRHLTFYTFTPVDDTQEAAGAGQSPEDDDV